MRGAWGFLLLVCVGLLPAVASATDVQGTLTTSAVWKKSGSPYVLTGDVTVGWGVTLVIEPGVKVVASMEDALRTGVDARRVELTVDGTLLVRGTGAEPVVFTSRGDRGAWYGIRVRGGRGTVIDGAVIDQAKQGLSLGMSAVVRNTSVRATVDDCLRVSWGSATLTGSRLQGCGENGLSVGEWARVRMEKTVVAGSGGNGVELRGGGELYHNTIHGNGASGVVLLGKAEAPVVRDSLITSNAGHGVYKSQAARGIILYNDVWGNGSGNYGASAYGGPGSFSRDPLYVSATDLRPGIDSPVRGVASDGGDLGALEALRISVAARPREARGHDASTFTSADLPMPRRGLMAGPSVRGRQLFPTAAPQPVEEGVAVASAAAAASRKADVPEPVAVAGAAVKASRTVDARPRMGRDFVPANREPQPVAFISTARLPSPGAPSAPKAVSRPPERRVKAAPATGSVARPGSAPAPERRHVEVSLVPVSPSWRGLNAVSVSRAGSSRPCGRPAGSGHHLGPSASPTGAERPSVGFSTTSTRSY